jgi:uncharacterized protein (TIGR02646 family)
VRAIVKGREPPSLTTHRLTQFASFDNFASSDELRDSLVSEQRGICCYCMQRIHASRDGMRIEHWHSQSCYPGEQLDYRNLLAACKGNEGRPQSETHCDVRKANVDLSRHPADLTAPIDRDLHYSGDGRISSTDAAFDAELNGVLNLNFDFLVKNRQETLRAFTAALQHRGTLAPATLTRWLSKWRGDNRQDPLLPYAQVIVYWLEKRIRRT